jgi:hypothetical protein
VVEVYQAYNKYVVPRKQKKRLLQKRELGEKSLACQSCSDSLERSLKGWVENGKFEKGFNLSGNWDMLLEFKDRIGKYNETYDRCVDLKNASKAVIILHLQTLAREHLPNTSKEQDLVSLFNAEQLVERYLKGEDITKHLIEQKYPTGLYDVLIESLKDKETKLDLFLLRMTEAFQKDAVLNRFRMEREDVSKLGHSLLGDLNRRKEAIQKELDKYKDIEG